MELLAVAVAAAVVCMMALSGGRQNAASAVLCRSKCAMWMGPLEPQPEREERERERER